MTNTYRIANAAGFYGDQLDAARHLLARESVDVLTLEYLAELTMSILAHQRAKNPQLGYATDFLEVLTQVLPQLRSGAAPRIVTNAGGVNPRACAVAAARLLADSLPELPIGVVDGDDLLPEFAEHLRAGCRFVNLDSGEAWDPSRAAPACAHAYLGAAPLVEALRQDAAIVITGRVADASLTVAPLVAHYGWDWEDWDRLAAASVAGHLIECGAQVTGGYSTRWQNLDLANVGYPIAEVAADGSCLVTKPQGTGGVVDRQSVVEQLVYEIGDPAAYLTPDVTVDFTRLEVQELGHDRVRVWGARGTPPPDSFKVSLAYLDGYAASAQLVVAGPGCVAKAEACGQMVFERLRRAGWQFAQQSCECLGAGAAAPRFAPAPEPAEVVLRLSVQDPRREAVARFTREIAPLITSGPAGLGGYASGRSPVRPVSRYWPATIPKTAVAHRVVVQTARQWRESEPSPPNA